MHWKIKKNFIGVEKKFCIEKSIKNENKNITHANNGIKYFKRQ